jgi:hypothetical protein
VTPFPLKIVSINEGIEEGTDHPSVNIVIAQWAEREAANVRCERMTGETGGLQTRLDFLLG